MFDLRTHFYCSFTLRFAEGEEFGWTRAISVTRDWLEHKLQRWSVQAKLHDDWFLEGVRLPLVFGHHVIDVAVSNEAEGSLGLWSLSYQHDDATWHYRKWRTEVTISRSSTELTYTLRLSHFVAGDWVGVEPDLPSHSIPVMIAAFLKAQVAYSGGVPLQNVPIVVKFDQAAQFKQFLESEERTLPIVLVSKNSVGSTLINSKGLARSLASIAFVCEVMDGQCDLALAQILPQEFRTYGGAVRLYMPNVDTTKPSDSFRHRYFQLGDQADGNSSIEAMITRAALRRVAIQQHRSLVSVAEVRLQHMLSDARLQDDGNALSSAMTETITSLQRIQEEQYSEYCTVVARLESTDGHLQSLLEELRDKNFQLAELRRNARNKIVDKESDGPLDIFRGKINQRKIELPIACIRSKQDPSFIDAVAEAFSLLPYELDEILQEEVCEHSSNLVSNIIKSHKGRVLLYAHGHLKYFDSSEKEDFIAFFGASKVRDAVKRFSEWLG